ncbi:DUF4422 domain-containing protein [Clostridium sp. OS1-26]|uniref:DUF4422 domain-containing protein n=1 Tax=Clostridium sp. OS1-26 TaxID=3070681 RepID=UPI0027E157EC|nr:DUF4422 domain-containing protein [Clostridium sp. OS1-26]WML36759.1 DUF4422 domain-containing protein [Clostridium sp. OS1-26]
MSFVKILVCCHKETAYLENDIFKPILLGTNNADEKLLGFFDNNFKDNQGINISDKHPYYAELTSIYWAWKNYEQLGNPEYIGLFHYRRFFNFKGKINGNDPWQYAFLNFNKSSQKDLAGMKELSKKFVKVLIL